MAEEKNPKHVDYTKVQQPICEIPYEGTLPDTPEYCPTCIIDPNAPKRNWWNERTPYLEKSTCEYYIPVEVNADGRSFNTRELKGIKVPFNVFSYSYLRNGIRTALKFFNKMSNDEIVCAMISKEEMESGINPKIVKPHLYKEREMWKHLGKFSIYQQFQDKNGDQFRIQEPDYDLIGKFPKITNPMALEMFAFIKDYHLGNGMEPIKMLVAIPAYVFDNVPTSIAAALGETEEEEEGEKDPQLKTEVVIDGKTFKDDMTLLFHTFGAWSRYQALFYNVNSGRIKQNVWTNPEKQKNFYLKLITPDIKNFKGVLEDLLFVNGYTLGGDGKFSAKEIRISFATPVKDKPYRISKVEAKFPNCEFEPCTVNFQEFLSKPATQDPTVLNYVANLPDCMPFITEMEDTPWLDWLEKYTYPPVQVSFGDDVQSDIPCIEAGTNPDQVDDALFKFDFDPGAMFEWLFSQMNCKTLEDMADYDPFKDINDLQNKFADLLDNFQFTDNDVVAELFGLPMDIRAMAAKGFNVGEFLEGLMSRLTICNLLALLLEVLKCIFSGFNLAELLRILCERILLLVPPVILESIYNALNGSVFPQLVDHVPSNAAARLLGFDTPPWEYYHEVQEQIDKGNYWNWTRKAYEIAEEDAPAGEGTATTEAYTTVDAIIDVSADRRSGTTEAIADAKAIIDTFDGGLPGLTQSGWLYQNALDLETATGIQDVGSGRPQKPTYTQVFVVWVEEIVAVISDEGLMDELIKQLQNVKGGQILQLVILLFGCPNKHFLQDLFGELKGMFNFGHLLKGCALGQPRAVFPPVFPKINLPSLKDILQFILKLLIKKLIDLIAMILLAILLKLLMALSCAGLKALINFFKNGFELGDDGLKDAINSICDENGIDPDDPDKLDNVMGILDNAGISGNPEDIDAFARDISAGVPANDFKAAFLNPMELQDPDLMAQIADMVNSRHPEHAPVLGSPLQVAAFFSSIGALLSPEQRDLIQSTLDEDAQPEPMDPSICLTAQEKLDWDEGRRAYINDLCGNLPLDGFRPGEEPEPLEDDLWPYPDDRAEPTLGDDWLDKLNDRERSNLDDFLDLFLNGPAAAISDALNEAMKPGVINCAFDPETGEPIEPDEEGAADNKSVIPAMPPEITNAMDDAKASMLIAVENRFVEDLQGSYHSFFNHLFADTYNAPFYQGSRRRPSHDDIVKHPFIAPNAADTQEQWQDKWDTVKDRFVFPRFFMQAMAPRNEDDEVDTDNPFPTNVYPQTIGLWMRDSLFEEIENIDFSSEFGIDNPAESLSFIRPYTRKRWGLDKEPIEYNISTPAEPTPNLVMKFRDNNNGKGGGWNYGFNLKLVNHITDDAGNQLKVPGYRVILEELESLNTPNALSFTARYGPVLAPPAEVKVIRDELFNVQVEVSAGDGDALLQKYMSIIEDSELKKYTNGAIVFKNYIRQIYQTFGVENEMSDDLLAKDLYESLNNFVYSSVVNGLLEDPNGSELELPGYTVSVVNADGDEVEQTISPQELTNVPEAYMFGYVDNNLTKADLTYVDTSAEGYSPTDPDTWEYNHKNRDKVLGGSATGHPRVEFLDPEVHDMGKYTRPKIYIRPPDYTGWLALNQLFIPELDNHDPKRETFMFIDDLIKKEKDLRDEIPMDPRLDDPHACVQEGPYDVFSDPAGHAGCHTAVLAMIRVFAFEHMMKSMATYQMLKPDYEKNFDESVLAAIVEDMEEELKDLPRRRSKRGYFRGHNFWLLFLEQSVQTLERMLIVGDIKATPEITRNLQTINDIRDNFPPLDMKFRRLLKHVRTVYWDGSGQISNIEFAYSRKVNGKKVYYPLNYELDDKTRTTLYNFIDSVMFYSLGRNFRNILKNKNRNFAYRMRKRQRRMFKMASKLYAINSSKEAAKSLLKYIVGQQLKYYGDKLEQISKDTERAGPRPQPHIIDLKKYFFGSSQSILTPLKGGLFEEETEYEQAVREAGESGGEIPVFDYGGSIKHVVHNPREENPVDYFSPSEISKLKDSAHGNLYFEKYLRIVDKPEGHGSETAWYNDNQKSIVQGRDDLLKGVVNIKEFQKFLKDNLTELGGLSSDTIINEEGESVPYSWMTKISNIFGDAKPVFEQPEGGEEGEEAPDAELIGYDGSIGIKFGVRLCYIPKSDFNPSLNYGDTVPNKSFLFKEAEDSSLTDHNPRKIFPLISYERDLTDKEIVNINLDDDNFGEDLKCYIQEILNSQEMNMVFNYCAPIKRASSLMALYSNYAFVPSVGEHPLERDTNGPAPTEYWKTVVLLKTKNSLRHLFIGNYSSVLYYSEKVSRRGNGFNFNMFEFYKRLFQILINPFAWFSGLSASWGGAKISRRVVDRPYDMYDNPEGADDGVE